MENQFEEMRNLLDETTEIMLEIFKGKDFLQYKKFMKENGKNE